MKNAVLVAITTSLLLSGCYIENKSYTNRYALGWGFSNEEFATASIAVNTLAESLGEQISLVPGATVDSWHITKGRPSDYANGMPTMKSTEPVKEPWGLTDYRSKTIVIWDKMPKSYLYQILVREMFHSQGWIKDDPRPNRLMSAEVTFLLENFPNLEEKRMLREYAQDFKKIQILPMVISY